MIKKVLNKIETDIREHSEKLPVNINLTNKNRLVVAALNEGGCNGTDVDLLDILSWVKSNMPELIALNRGWETMA